ncbi:MAG: hypothetical protein ABSG04_06665 [Verrucomicrobiota bacterium]|jgi:hypothetical protein
MIGRCVIKFFISLVGTARRAVRASQRDAPAIEELRLKPKIGRRQWRFLLFLGAGPVLWSACQTSPTETAALRDPAAPIWSRPAPEKNGLSGLSGWIWRDTETDGVGRGRI